MKSPLIVAATLLAACHRIPPSDLALTPIEAVQGSYDYAANIQGREVRGRFVIAGKSVFLTNRGASCENLTRRDNLDSFTLVRYTCAGLSENHVDFAISLRSPITQSTWKTSVLGRRSRTVCDQYVIGRGGREVCRSSHTESYDADVSLSGTLVVRRSETALDRVIP